MNALKPREVLTAVYQATVDRTLAPEQILAATGRRQHVDSRVLATMPRGSGQKTKVTFFQLEYPMCDDDVARMYDSLDLKPDPYAVVAVNAEVPEFADKYNNAGQWQLSNGTWAFVSFRRDGGKRIVCVGSDDSCWAKGYWFGGVDA